MKFLYSRFFLHIRCAIGPTITHSLDMIKKLIFLFLLFQIIACSVPKLGQFTYPEPVDTSTRPIEMQEKKNWSIGGVHADNQFDAARLNDFSQLNDSTWQATITPENFPINMSPWYAFRLWADTGQDVQLRMHYEQGRHRYPPKTSPNGRVWQPVDSTSVTWIDSNHVLVKLHLNSDTIFFAAQELVPSRTVESWCSLMALHPAVTYGSAGISKQGRNIPMLLINEGEPKGKEMVVILSRQHPPEVTGYFAMQAFVEELVADKPLSNAFRKKYRILVFPLMNPDGVDNGHWRHNAGGIDLNRDWAYYRQPEVRQVAARIVQESNEFKNRVVLGLDFHSTWKDLYYTFDETLPSVLHGYKDYWLQGIEEAIPGYEADDRPNGLNQPISKTWFFQQFRAESVTYEIGDDTPRDFVRKKGAVAAVEMMELLILRTPLR